MVIVFTCNLFHWIAWLCALKWIMASITMLCNMCVTYATRDQGPPMQVHSGPFSNSKRPLFGGNEPSSHVMFLSTPISPSCTLFPKTLYTNRFHPSPWGIPCHVKEKPFKMNRSTTSGEKKWKKKVIHDIPDCKSDTHVQITTEAQILRLSL